MYHSCQIAADLETMGGTKHTGAMAESSVSSKTFSIADLEGSIGGGLTSVG